MGAKTVRMRRGWLADIVWQAMPRTATSCTASLPLRCEGHGSEMTVRRRAGGVPCSRKMGYGLPEVPQLRPRTLVRRKSLSTQFCVGAHAICCHLQEWGRGGVILIWCIVCCVQASELCILKSCPAYSRVSLFLSCFVDTVRIVHHRPCRRKFQRFGHEGFWTAPRRGTTRAPTTQPRNKRGRYKKSPTCATRRIFSFVRRRDRYLRVA
ncbi:hypothetical protein MPH_07878 [Macrophomina phaseolina MS6]|uniref:Uncharacterized protein n=1 Tax=Macrophomina phaseolina (strain MS6) TaxID=1126212 RepID=K2RK03_MACPH|nr:hypothetical protein MPH_07878 [Macrophomina phaseolina MS6]